MEGKDKPISEGSSCICKVEKCFSKEDCCAKLDECTSKNLCKKGESCVIVCCCVKMTNPAAIEGKPTIMVAKMDEKKSEGADLAADSSSVVYAKQISSTAQGWTCYYKVKKCVPKEGADGNETFADKLSEHSESAGCCKEGEDCVLVCCCIPIKKGELDEGKSTLLCCEGGSKSEDCKGTSEDGEYCVLVCCCIPIKNGEPTMVCCTTDSRKCQPADLAAKCSADMCGKQVCCTAEGCSCYCKVEKCSSKEDSGKVTSDETKSEFPESVSNKDGEYCVLVCCCVPITKGETVESRADIDSKQICGTVEGCTCSCKIVKCGSNGECVPEDAKVKVSGQCC